MANFDFDLLAEIAEKAPVAGGGVFTGYGRVWMDNLQVVSWKDRMPIKVPYEGGKLEQGQTLEFQLHQEIAKQDGSTFNKTWFIQIRDSGKRSKTDWGEIVKPSVISAFGGLGTFFKAVSGKGNYCAVEDYDTGRDSKKNDSSGNPYPVMAPKFIEAFKSKADCEKARAEKFSKNESNGKIPQNVVNSFKAYISAFGNDRDTAVAELKDGKYEGYEVADLLATLE